MEKTKIGMFQAIALILTITINHTLLALPRNIMDSIGSASLLNILYVGIIAILASIIIGHLLSKFPGYDILDISEYLGGKFLKFILGFLFLVYLIVISSVLLKDFSNCLQIIYYPMTDLVFIISLFIIAVAATCNLKHNAAFKVNLLVLPLILFSIVFLFIANSKYFNYENIYPIFGNGFSNILLSGSSNLYAFGGLACLYLIPPTLMEPKKLKKISVVSTLLSLIYLLLSIGTLLLMFHTQALSGELSPLYSAVRYIEFGTFFQRLDSAFLFIWILSFTSYLCITTIFALNILQKITNIQTSKPLILPFIFIILAASLLQKTENITQFLETTIFKYGFFGFTIILCTGILILANTKKKFNKEEHY